MALPKKLYVVERDSSGGNWLDAGRSKADQVENDGDIVGTYELVAKERGKSIVEFAKVK